MSLSRRIVKCINFLISLIVILALLIFGSYSAFSLWDNQQVYNAAKDIQIQMLGLKPVQNESDDGNEAPSFDELHAVNPDVCGWVTIDGTQIDYPILQGETNLTYINTDV